MKRQGDIPWFSMVTPPGPAGVAVWMIGGAGACDLISDIFVPHGSSRPALPSNQFLGVLDVGGSVSDEVLLVRPAGVKETPWIEIHAHGGAQLEAMHRSLFAKAGFEEKSPETPEVFPCQTRLQSHLQQLAIRATTSLACKGFLHQAQVLPEALCLLIQSCKNGEGARAIASLAELESGWNLARRWLVPFRVSVMGAPNVGKSSLLNFLAGKKRAVVSPIPGTTVDLVRVAVALDGWPIELFDTAGVRETADDLEQKGIDLALHSAGMSDLVLWLWDGTDTNQKPEEPTGIGLENVLEVWTKSDLVAAPKGHDYWNGKLAISTLTGAGCQELQAAILKRLVGKDPMSPIAPAICSEPLAITAAEVRGLLSVGDYAGAMNRLDWWMETVLESN